MKLRLTISGKLGLSFGFLSLAYLLFAFFIYLHIEKSKVKNNQIISIYQPSVENLANLRSMLVNSKMLLNNWVFLEKEEITSNKLNLRQIITWDIAHTQNNILGLYKNWSRQDMVMYDNIKSLINDSILPVNIFITSALAKPEDYNNKQQLARIEAMLMPNSSFSNLNDKIVSKLTLLLQNQQEIVNAASTELGNSFEKIKTIIINWSILLVVLAAFISYFTIHSQIKPINYIKNILISMGKGILPKENIKVGKDEIGEISGALNSLVNGLKEISNFSIEIGKGNFNSEFKPLSDEDILGNSLIKMQEELKNAAIEEEKRKKEDAQRNWATQGIAKFSEILRQNNNNLSDLSYNVVSNLVNYLNANQGGFFIINDNSKEEIYLELAGCYAYNRQKFLKKSYMPGEGLVGRCYLERATIYLTDIPKDYIKITSGLGDDNPTSLLIVPLLYNEKVFGVIELASFSEIEPYQIEFVEKLASSIASTISAVTINIQTTRLLEQSRQQAEEMAAQEEEMRQNMEELRATQEETARKEAAMQKELKELKKRLSKYEL